VNSHGILPTPMSHRAFKREVVEPPALEVLASHHQPSLRRLRMRAGNPDPLARSELYRLLWERQFEAGVLEAPVCPEVPVEVDG
jgi:hypothetical protein